MSVDTDTYMALEAEVVALRRRVAELEGSNGVHPESQNELLRNQQIAIEASLDGIAILDAQGVYRYMNSAHATIHGYDRAEDLIGQTWEVVVPDNLLSWYQQEAMPQLYRDGQWQGEAD